MIKRISRITVLALLALLAMSAASVWYIAYTESGLRLVIRLLPGNFGKSTMRIGKVSGTLAGGLHVENFELVHPRATVRASGISARVSVLPLLWQTIAAHEVVIAEAFVQVRPRLGPPRRPPRFLPRFLAITAEGAVIRKAVLVATNGRRFDGTDVKASGSIFA